MYRTDPDGLHKSRVIRDTRTLCLSRGFLGPLWLRRLGQLVWLSESLETHSGHPC